MVLLQALELERTPTRAELETELQRPKGYAKQRIPSSHMSDISAGASRLEHRSPSSCVTDVALQRDMDIRLGGLEASMKLILEHLQILQVKGNIALFAVTQHVECGEDSSAAKQPEEDVINASERCHEVCIEQDPVARAVCYEW
jgi:hypothetical protein